MASNKGDIMAEDAGWFSDETATFGDRLAGAREGAGQSQEALASKIGVKTSVIAGWENDIKEPRANRLQMLSGLLGVSLSWLLTGEGDGPQAPSDEEPISVDVNEILTEIRVLRTQMTQSAAKLGQLEKRLRTALRDTQ